MIYHRNRCTMTLLVNATRAFPPRDALPLKTLILTLHWPDIFQISSVSVSFNIAAVCLPALLCSLSKGSEGMILVTAVRGPPLNAGAEILKSIITSLHS